ncbi:MAG: hypothetical protein ACE5G8_09875 [Anaerolineae bacterium]
MTDIQRHSVIFMQKLILGLARHWEAIAIGMFIAVLGGAVLAPALMAAGLTDAGEAVYRFFAPHDHQLPQRSYFLFSSSGGVKTYSLEQILAWGGQPHNLRAFTGTPDIGFKTALNQRMIAIFIGLLVGAVLYSGVYLQPNVNRLGLALLTFPMFFDALSYMLGERTGSNMRYLNLWAVKLTGGGLPGAFYTGTTTGSLNWLLRTVTGLLFGLATAWYLGAYFDRSFTAIRRQLEPRLRKIRAIK